MTIRRMVATDNAASKTFITIDVAGLTILSSKSSVYVIQVNGFPQNHTEFAPT
jgi:flagellar biogenesis protein FliO